LPGINFTDSPGNFLLPGILNPIIMGRVRALYQVMGQFRPFGLRKCQNFRT
jgi:hypothetical protein